MNSIALSSRGNLKRAGAAAATVLVVLFLAAWWTGREERRINSRLGKLCDLASKDGPENAIPSMVRAREFSGYFVETPAVILDSPALTISDRTELAGIVLQIRSSFERIQVRIRDRKLAIRPGKDAADMSVTAQADLTSGGQTETDIREFRIEWVKRNGQWLIAGASAASSIRRPAGTTP